MTALDLPDDPDLDDVPPELLAIAADPADTDNKAGMTTYDDPGAA